MLVKEAKKIIGIKSGIRGNKKTGMSFSLPAVTSCKVGCKLSKEKGSTCYGCYAKNGNYTYKNVKTSQRNRLDRVKQLSNKKFKDNWVEAMILLIQNKIDKISDKEKYFRWHDSGDIVSIHHIKAIAEVCENLPSVKFWIASKEVNLIEEFTKHNDIPENLCIRLSGYYVDKEPKFLNDLPTAMVYHKTKPKCKVCQAVVQHKSCLEVNCRACWDKNVKSVAYKKHN